MRRVAMTVVVVVVHVALALPASAEDKPFVALDPSDKTLALEQRGCGDSNGAEPSCADLAAALGTRPGRTVCTRSAFWAVSYRQAFRLAPPPKGFPRRTC